MAFWKPGTAGPGFVQERGGDAEAPVLVDPKLSHLPLSKQRQALPIYQYHRSLLYALETHRTLVIVGETGSGKTTQVPQYLHQAGWTAGGRAVVCTQPRRVAAVTVAARVAQEMGVELGEEVGYAVRFDEKCSKEVGRTALKFVTDGLLIREMMLDPLLSRYSVVMLDEAHERTVHNDILFGLLKKVMRQRSDLRLIVASATLDAEEFRDFFETADKEGDKLTATILSVQGRQHPVDILYLEAPADNYVRAAAEAALSIHETEPPGDILIFMPGAEEIDTVQMAVFEPAKPGIRKVIVATNVAETSITLDGVKYVVDPCFVRLPFYDPATGVESLVTTVTSKASATQRAGRAGRTSPGKCLRLVTETDFNSLLPARTPPEVQRTDLSGTLLLLKALGLHDIVRFDFLSPPTAEALARALELLYSLGAIDDSADITRPLGASMAELPLSPQLAKVLVASWRFGCVAEALTVAAMLSVRGPFERPRGVGAEAKQRQRSAMAAFATLEGDHITYINVYNAYCDEADGGSVDELREWCAEHCLDARSLRRAREIRGQLERYARLHAPPDHDNDLPVSKQQLRGLPSAGSDMKAVLRCLVSGFFSNAARLSSDGRYRTVREGTVLTFHPSSVLAQFGSPPEYVVYHEVVRTTQLFARDVSAVDPRWLLELAPHFFATRGGHQP
ncbi:P-loop containing nucleoside triphosphate hydrolase protein [Tribonema minus]|uniref:RNA helicase n=1 Tax=Tribonema minus TaxID=303371 RepID=A0A835Z495_9STRA|nr:P-loop containing nucleoside triphosphate hydrolase protein [Tribonema minus]